jgi:hypothetical protein
MRAFIAATLLLLTVAFVGCTQEPAEGGDTAAPAAETPAEQ